MGTWKCAADTLESSYRDHDYGQLIYGIVKGLQPRVCVEIGVLEGYSALHIAAALRDNGHGHLDAFDLWGDYPYKHGVQAEVQQMLDNVGLGEWVTLQRCDAMHVVGKLAVTPDLVHIDISNDGDTYLWAARTFGRMSDRQPVLLLEGGTAERDNTEWMRQGRRMSIVAALKRIAPYWNILTFPAYPGLTLMRRAE